MDPFEQKMNQSLSDFTFSLIPSDEYLKVVNKLSERVLTALKAKSKAPVSRVIYGGSLGKGTEIMAPDVDLVVIVNGELPPYDELLKDWELILVADKGLQVDVKSLKKTNISLQFKFLEDGIEVDLLPASNFVHGQQPGGKNLAEAQMNAVMSKINKRNFLEFSSSLCESQICFMKEQSAFAHQMVRLGKFWYNSLYIGQKRIYGVKSMLELISVSASMKEEGREANSLLRTFCKFLEDVGRITELRLAYKKNGEGKWTLTNGPPDGLPRDFVVGTNFIFEPTNVFNDLAKNFKNRDDETKNLMNFAKMTRERIRQAMGNRQVGPNVLFELFRPLLTPLFPKMFPTMKFDKPGVYSDTNSSFRRYHPEMIVHNLGIYNKKEMGAALTAIQMYMYTATATATAALLATGQPQQPEVALSNVMLMVRDMILKDIIGEDDRKFIVVGHKHEDYDVTITVPLSTKIDLGALKTSFRWK